MTRVKESSRSHFEKVDTDHDNRVSVSELIGYVTDRFRISYGEAVDLVSRMDQDGDGFISFAEFESHYDNELQNLE